MIGKTFGDYRIESPLAAGGMGEVFLATDVPLNRPVALKLLSPKLAADPEYVARFKREAQSAAGLSHPNIATIYATGERDGRHYLAMEFISGETLEARMARGRIPARQALELMAQLAEGLAAAHAKGLIHRDIKPGNLMITEGGMLKILDFGLARPESGAVVMDSDSGARKDDSDSSQPTVEMDGMAGMAGMITTAGTILGTVAYMSPEQACGVRLDRRSDLFSAGVVLFELLAGKHPFKGNSAAETLANLLYSRPALPPLDVTGSDSGSDTKEIARIAGKCLAKEPAERYQHADELALDLKAAARQTSLLSGETTAVGGISLPAAPAIRLRRRLIYRIAAGAALLAAAIAGGVLIGRPRRASVARTLPQVRLLTRTGGMNVDGDLSPDGNTVVFSSNRGGRFKLYLRSLAGAETVQITKDDEREDGVPYFNPEGTEIYFRSIRVSDGGREIRAVPVLGGESRKLAEQLGLRGIFPGGDLLAGQCRDGRCGLFRLPKGGGDIAQVLAFTPEQYGDLAAAAVAPDGRTLHYVLRGLADKNAGLYEAGADGKSRKLAPFRNYHHTRIAYSDGGAKLITSAANQQGDFINLFSYDRRSGALTALTDAPGNSHYPVLSRDGRRLLYTYWLENDWIARLELTGRLPAEESSLRRLSEGMLDDEQPAWSPDGRQAVWVSNADDHYNLWIGESAPGRPRQLTFGTDHNFGPAWSRDGKLIYYFSNRGGRTAIRAIPVAGGEARMVSEELELENYVSESSRLILSPDGRELLVSARRKEGGHRLHRVDVGTGKSRPLGDADCQAAVFSPDGGHFYAITRLPGGGAPVAAENAPQILWRFDREGKAEKIAEVQPSVHPTDLAISPDGRYIYYVALAGGTITHDDVWRIALADGRAEPVTALRRLAVGNGLAVSPDGKSLLMNMRDIAAYQVLLDGLE